MVEIEIKIANLKETAQYNIEKLKKYLNEIHTVEIDKEFSEKETSKVNIIEEIYVTSSLLKIYEESLKNPSGKIYDEYSRYFEYSKKYLGYLNDLQKKIESENKDDILNAERLIEQYKILLTKN